MPIALASQIFCAESQKRAAQKAGRHMDIRCITQCQRTVLTMALILPLVVWVPALAASRRQLVAARGTMLQRASDPLREILAAQPNYQADVFVRDKGAKAKHVGALAKLGQSYRVEMRPPKGGRMVEIVRPGLPLLTLFPDHMLYDEGPEARLADFAMIPFTWLGDLSKRTDVLLEEIGTVTIDGHECTKIRVTREGSSKPKTFYAAKDLQNLVIKIELTETGEGWFSLADVYMLKNVSLEVAEDLFQVPAGYQRIRR